jgi:hypothetical protein
MKNLFIWGATAVCAFALISCAQPNKKNSNDKKKMAHPAPRNIVSQVEQINDIQEAQQ